MASPFDAAVKAAGAIHDRIMGETFEFHPMAVGNADVNSRAAITADPDRAIVLNLLAVWGNPSARTGSGAVRTIGVEPELPGHASDRPFISLDLSRLPYAPKRGDKVKRLANGQSYKIAEVLPSQPGFARLDLNVIG